MEAISESDWQLEISNRLCYRSRNRHHPLPQLDWMTLWPPARNCHPTAIRYFFLSFFSLFFILFLFFWSVKSLTQWLPRHPILIFASITNKKRGGVRVMGKVSDARSLRKPNTGREDDSQWYECMIDHQIITIRSLSNAYDIWSCS